MLTKQRTVLVTGARAPVALEWARRLHAAGYRVLACDSIEPHLCRASRAVADTFVVPSPRLANEPFAAALASIIEQQQVDVIVPTCEEIFYLAPYASLWKEKGAVLFASPSETLLRLHSKYALIQTAAAHGCHVPVTVRVSSRAELTDCLMQWPNRGRVVLKPEYSRFGSQVRVVDLQHGIRHVRAPQSLSPDMPWVVQQWLDGRPTCTYSIARDGELLAHAAYASRYTIGSGASVHFEAIDRPQLREWVAQFVAEERFTGQIGFDFMETDDGTPLPIECNPRATSGLHLLALDAPVGRFLEADMPSPQQSYDEAPFGNKAMVGVMMALSCLQPKWTWAERMEACRSLLSSRDVLFARGDSRPFWRQGAALWTLFRLSRQHRVTLAEASTIDLEWNGELR